MRPFAEGWPGVVALDGKTLRRSFDRAAGASPLPLVSAWATEQRLVLGQGAGGDKSHAITAVPQWLKRLSLSGGGVTADAMACQREIARTITDQGGADGLALKGHQGPLLEDVTLVLGDPALALATAQTTEGEHGRIEGRRAALTREIAFLQESQAWPSLQAVGQITATRETQTGTSQETRYCLLSEAFSPERFLAIVRAHGGLETGCTGFGM